MPRITNPLPQLIPARAFRARTRVQGMIWGASTPVELFIGPVNDDFIPLAEGMRQPMRVLAPGEFFGPKGQTWKHCWAKLDIPAAAPGEAERRFLRWEGFGEITVFHRGAPWWGIDWAHKEVPLPAEACTLWLSCGLWHEATAHGLQYSSAGISLRDAAAWQVFWDVEMLVQLMQYGLKKEVNADAGAFSWAGYKPKLETLSPWLRQLLRALDDAIDVFDQQGLVAFGQALHAIYARFPAESWQPALAMNGHAHIDLAWLWPETVANQKGMHTFASQLRLLELYPEFKFTQSQPALYRAVEGLSPEMGAQIKARIAEGRWEATGAAEVELDTLVPCGEAMARSVLYGQRKFRALRGGSPSQVCWLPDVFGYSASLPQILRQAGVPYFFTTKMTWSTITRFPYNSFIWRGSDGSEVLTHLCTRPYIGQANIEESIGALADHQQSDLHPELLLPSGWGDGGGGTTIEALERARRIANLSGVPRARWSTAEEFFQRMEAMRDRLPSYQGELYLEYHRGTYTTQSEIKRLHRAGERQLQIHEAVRVATGAGPLGEADWLRVLFAEFHDVLPGSSIRLVYAQLTPELEALQARVLAAAGQELAASGTDAGYLVFNPLPVARTAVVEVEGRQAAVQLPALGGVRLGSAPAAAPAGLREVSPRVLDNGLLRAEFDAHGQLAAPSVDGEALSLQAPGHFALYYDEPHAFDAWDVDHYTYKFPHPAGALSLEVAEHSPLRAVLRGAVPLGEQSTLEVRFMLDAGSRWLRVEAEVEWREAHRFLRYHLPTGYRGRWARFGNPFGSIQRAQQPGVQADEAMWEVPGNRWAAVLNEDGRGMAIITEAKYGFSCKDGDLGVSLLRSTKEPDTDADMGRHVIAFAVGRHEASTSGERYATPVAADVLFTPPLVTPGGGTIPSPFTLEDLGTLAPSWVLPAETGAGYLIRLHETHGSSGVARLRLHTPARTVARVDFLEQVTGALPRLGESEFEIPYQPYEIISVLVR